MAGLYNISIADGSTCPPTASRTSPTGFGPDPLRQYRPVGQRPARLGVPARLFAGREHRQLRLQLHPGRQLPAPDRGRGRLRGRPCRRGPARRGGLFAYDDSLPEDELELIAGADYSVAGFYLNTQYLRGGFPLALAAGASGAGKDFVLGAVEREVLDTRLKVRLGGAVDLRDGSWAFQPVLTVRPVSVAEVEFGAMLFRGEAGSAFAPLGDNDMAFLGARFRF